MDDVVDIALRVAEALERVGAEYFLGGSLASSMQGEPRATNDIDFVVDLRAHQVRPFVEALGPDFDVDQQSLVEAVRDRGSWNIFYLPQATKIDLFVRRDEPYDRAEFERRELVEISPGRRLVIKRPEDTVLRKLLWFQAGGGASTKQWRDVVEVLRVSAERLDREYLARWADRLAIEGLLARAWADAQAP